MHIVHNAIAKLNRDSPEPPANMLRLVRLRLRLAMLTMAVVPMALSVALIRIMIGSFSAAEAFGIAALMGLLALLIMGLTIWMSHQVLRPAEELDRSRSEMRRLYELAREDSLRDGLTGLGNHRAFQEELDRELEWYHRYNVPIALLLIDLDDLKLVNDSEGHAAGDELLREMGRLITDVVRYADRGFRIGGDEFAILMPHTDSKGAQQVADRLLEQAMRAPGNGRAVPFSGGISACPEYASTRTQLYAQADGALYWCKRHGRAAIDVFHPERDRAASLQASTELSDQIAHVVTEHMIRPVYQPIVDLTSGRVLGFEGLSRPTRDSGFADPLPMFTAAETVGRTVELDLACLYAVVAGAQVMPADQLLTINISPRTLEAPHFSTDALLEILGRHGIEPERVAVELTEREKIEDINRLRAVVNGMRRRGLRIAADDIGAGNAGLRLLSQIRFDIVKIDVSLVQEGAESDSSRAVLRSLRELAGRWSASIIAEGVETAEQLRMVRDMGMSAGQGYLLARPMQLPDLTLIDIAALEEGNLFLERRPSSLRGAMTLTDARRAEAAGSPNA